MFTERLEQLDELLRSSECATANGANTLDDALTLCHFFLAQVQKVKGIVYVVGNGGSQAIASHFSTDCLRTLSIASSALSDPSNLTCFSNDMGYTKVYSYPLSLKMKSSDILVAISSSGASQNILEAVYVARQKKAPVITLSGFAFDNPLRSLGDLNIWLNSFDYGLVEMGHFFILHTVIDTLCKQRSSLLTK